MQSFLDPGDYVGGIPSKRPEQAIGYNCIIIDKKCNYYVSRLETGDFDNHYHLKSLNPTPVAVKKHIENIKIELAVPIIWNRKPTFKN